MASEHALADLAAASVLHAGRPTVVTVGVGAAAVSPAPPPVAATPKTLAPDPAQASHPSFST
jgi:uroporphyrin-III C-methyltransferase